MKEQEIELLEAKELTKAHGERKAVDAGNEGGIKQTEAPKQVYWGQSLLVSLMGGIAYFINGFLTHQDFPVTCLYFSGFLIVVTIYRLLMIKVDNKPFTLSTIKSSFLGNLYDFQRQQLRKAYCLKITIRSFLLLIIYWCGMSSIHYAQLANINFGIIQCCFIVSVVVNSAAAFVFFNERITLKTGCGICVTMAGIISISLLKGSQAIQKNELSDEVMTNLEQDATMNKYISIALALCVGVGNSMQTIIAKFLMKEPSTRFGVVSITSDVGLLFGMISLCFSIFYYSVGAPSFNLYNLGLILISSILAMNCWLVGQNACVRGVAGPALSIIYTSCFFTTLFQVIFLGLIPTIFQVLSAMVAFIGILMIIFFK